MSWDIPVLKSQEYSINDIFEKHLYMLIPFYLLTYEKDLEQAQRTEAIRKEIRKDYENIFRLLEEAVSEGYLDTYQMLAIRKLSKTICEHMTAGYSDVKKELIEVMGGKILDYEAKDILNRGISQGISQGVAQGIQALIATCKELNVSFETTAEKLKSKFQLNDKETQENMQKYWK